MSGSSYVNEQRREYSLYVLQQRAIPHAADGLKASARRVLWMAKDGKKYKSATLAGATLPIHPSAPPEGAINTLAAPHGNNVPLLASDCAFGTLLNPTAYGAARYTSVKTSRFCREVVFRDIEIIPFQENYDGTIQEPVHFLPLVPIVLLNPQEGIAVGFASTILPHSLKGILKAQIDYLEGRDYYEELPEFAPTNQTALEYIEDENGNMYKFVFHGEFRKTSATTVKVTNLPYGLTHARYIDKLIKLDDEGKLFFNPNHDDASNDAYSIALRFKKGVLSKMDDGEILEYIGLVNTETENMTMIDFDGKRVFKTTFGEIIQKFCDWRLNWYVKRYERLASILEMDMQKYKDVLRAINKNVGSVAKKIASRSELKEFLDTIGIVNISYIADLPIYRFTEEEKQKTEQKLTEATVQLKEYKALLKSEPQRRAVYVSELQEIQANHRKGAYNDN